MLRGRPECHEARQDPQPGKNWKSGKQAATPKGDDLGELTSKKQAGAASSGTASVDGSGIRNRGSGVGSSSTNPATPPRVATHSAGRSPTEAPSSPPSSAPSGRVP